MAAPARESATDARQCPFHGPPGTSGPQVALPVRFGSGGFLRPRTSRVYGDLAARAVRPFSSTKNWAAALRIPVDQVG